MRDIFTMTRLLVVAYTGNIAASVERAARRVRFKADYILNAAFGEMGANVAASKAKLDEDERRARERRAS